MYTAVDMIKQAQRTEEHADFSLKRGTPMREKFRHTGKGNRRMLVYHRMQVLLQTAISSVKNTRC